MGSVTYRNGIAIIQLILFPAILAIAFIIWKRVGWRAGAKTWRCVASLSLIRIAGSICSLLTINHPTKNIFIAEAVCQLIGIAPLLLTYIGLLRQIDNDQTLHPRALNIVAIATFIGLIIGIAGISITDSTSAFHANGYVVGAMSIFLAVFVLIYALALWLLFLVRHNMSTAQKKFFLAIGLSFPLLLVRIVYSSLSDFTDNWTFALMDGNPTAYLLMSVLEEIIAMGLCVFFGWSAANAMDHAHKEVPRTDVSYTYGV